MLLLALSTAIFGWLHLSACLWDGEASGLAACLWSLGPWSGCRPVCLPVCGTERLLVCQQALLSHILRLPLGFDAVCGCMFATWDSETPVVWTSTQTRHKADLLLQADMLNPAAPLGYSCGMLKQRTSRLLVRGGWARTTKLAPHVSDITSFQSLGA